MKVRRYQFESTKSQKIDQKVVNTMSIREKSRPFTASEWRSSSRRNLRLPRKPQDSPVKTINTSCNRQKLNVSENQYWKLKVNFCILSKKQTNKQTNKYYLNMSIKNFKKKKTNNDEYKVIVAIFMMFWCKYFALLWWKYYMYTNLFTKEMQTINARKSINCSQ